MSFREIWKMPFLCMSRLSPLKRGKNIHKHWQCCLLSIPVLYTWYVTIYMCTSDDFLSVIICSCIFSISTNLPSPPWISLLLCCTLQLFRISDLFELGMFPFYLMVAFLLNTMTNTMKNYLLCP